MFLKNRSDEKLKLKTFKSQEMYSIMHDRLTIYLRTGRVHDICSYVMISRRPFKIANKKNESFTLIKYLPTNQIHITSLPLNKTRQL